MNHIYIQTAFLGDLLLAVPSLRQIRYWSPQSHLTLVCRKGLGSLMRSLGVVDEVIEVDKKQKQGLAKKLRGKEFHTLFCPHQSMSSHKLVSGLQAEQKVGYKKIWNSNYFDKRVQRRLEWPEAIRQLQLVAAVDDKIEVKLEAFSQKTDQIPQWSEMFMSQLHWSEGQLEEMLQGKAVEGLRVDKPYICMAPGSVWETKRWPPSSFKKVAVELSRWGFQVVLLGAPDERVICEGLSKQIPNSFSLAGHLSIFESLKILSKSKGLLCNDSGSMHMASLLHLPCIAFFGPTVQELGYKPWNPKAVVIEKNDLLCRPCGQHGGRYCPIGTHQCMEDISPEFVLKKIKQHFK